MLVFCDKILSSCDHKLYRYEIMTDCWNLEPGKRPDFKRLGERIGMLLEESTQQHYMDLDNPYSNENQELQSDESQSDIKITEIIDNSESTCTNVNNNPDKDNSKRENKVHYDTVKCIKPVSGDIVITPMETVPMIHLEKENNEVGENPEVDEVQSSNENIENSDNSKEN
ncbi:vascular endothelial growth factor receptor kdr-like isoform X1 [Centruroides sculpturatus]|uniref:vascular endothelial growth factor receptor kdr-like isoform X1 n=1 Tax=Centruroides sculpturatus TaxID=218467 RepID=UPI000C6CC35F|nr:vascular endothelial growth factor receptor kdr-like isoform X1 [Centruroides sculpturatus]